MEIAIMKAIKTTIHQSVFFCKPIQVTSVQIIEVIKKEERIIVSEDIVIGQTTGNKRRQGSYKLHKMGCHNLQGNCDDAAFAFGMFQSNEDKAQ